MLATFTVTNNGDELSTEGTLRWAIAEGNESAGPDRIEFESHLAGAVISLSHDEIAVTEELYIDATSLRERVTIDGNNRSRLFHVAASSDDRVWFQGLRLTGGYTEDHGGAIRGDGGTVILQDAVVVGNSALNHGGGIFGDRVQIQNATIEGNSAGEDGGGVHATRSFHGSRAQIRQNVGASGGGVFAASQLHLTDVELANNVADSGGGAWAGGSTDIRRTTISGNSAHDGGGIEVDDGPFTCRITHSVVRGNTAVNGAGIKTTKEMSLADSEISQNIAEGVGGGIDSAAKLIITSSTISGNSARRGGGGVYLSASELVISHSTIAFNQSDRDAGGISAARAAVTLDHTILAANAAPNSPDLAVDDAPGLRFTMLGDVTGTPLSETQMADANGNLIGSASGDGTIDPELKPLSNASTFSSDAPRFHELEPTSPAVNAGDPLVVPGENDVPASDQRGWERVFDGVIDIGAVEQTPFLSLPFTVTTANDEQDGNYSADDLSLREAITLVNSTGTWFSPIEFALQLAGATLNLRHGPLEISRAALTAEQLAEPITIDASLQSRIANVHDSFGVTNLILRRGMAPQGSPGGGAIYLSENASLVLTDSRVEHSAVEGVSGSGGAIFGGQQVNLENTVIANNSAPGLGGGIYTSGSVFSRQSSIIRNSAGGDGGGVYGSSISLIQSTVSGNKATDHGASGGGVLATSSLFITNSTVSANSAASAGGGAFSTAPTVSLRFSTITNNSSGVRGGGVAMASQTTNVRINHSIIASNVSQTAADVSVIEPITLPVRAEHSLIGDNVGSSLAESQLPDVDGNLIGSSNGDGTLDPMLEPLADNGGPTQTHALRSESRAVDAGAAGIAEHELVFPETGHYDQRSAGRKFGGAIDIGAVEWAPQFDNPIVVSSLNDERDGDFSQVNLSLREAVELANGHVGPAEIVFLEELFTEPQTLELQLGEMTIVQPLSLMGPGLSLLTIDAKQQSGIFTVLAGSLLVSDMTLTAGRAISGGAISAFGGAFEGPFGRPTVEVHRSLLTASTAIGEAAEANGGAISGWDVTIVDSTISANTASTGGGVHAHTLNVRNSTVDNNTAQAGGGLWAHSLSLRGSTISGNSAFGSGGGVLVAPSFDNVVQIKFSTIAYNYSAFSAGGIGGTSLDDWIVDHSVIAMNRAARGPDLDSGAAPNDAVIAFSLIGDLSGSGLVEAQTPDANGNLVGDSAGAGTIDPRLQPLTNNGGRTKTHVPRRESVIVNAGDPLFSVGSEPSNESDQRGYARLLGGRVDMGAVERRNALGWHRVSMPADVDGDNVVTPIDALIAINELTLREYSSPTTGRLTAVENAPLFLDVDDDGTVGPIDALVVINQLPSTSSSSTIPALRPPKPIDDERHTCGSSWSICLVDMIMAFESDLIVPKA